VGGIRLQALRWTVVGSPASVWERRMASVGRNRFVSIVWIVSIWVGIWVEPARAFYPDQTPNYPSFGCLTCHNNSSGGGGCASPPCLIQFGIDFANNGHAWNYWLAIMDSDGDGFTNGREVLDYYGSWRPGNANPGPNGYATYPGYYTSAMSECTINANGGYVGYNACASVASCSEANGAYPGYSCTCPGGYTAAGSPSGSVCNDIDECSPSNPCGVGGCTNYAGGFTCNCPSGYAFNGATCAQDACSRNVDNCGSGTVCNPDASNADNWTCSCSSGYQNVDFYCVSQYYDPFWGWLCNQWEQRCSNIDECTNNSPPCPSTSACVDTVGSHTCTPCGANAAVASGAPVNNETCVCNAGFSGDPYAGCSDINECLVANDCAVGTATCTNTVGSHSCACNPGYTGSGTACSDIDECTLQTDLCSDHADCLNGPGTYDCACKAGYDGDGRLCKDLDECAAGTDTCGAGQVCANAVGTYRCDCAPGFASDGAGGCVGGCGNGVVLLPEWCDDGNMTVDDGCSANCRVEPGYACHESQAGKSTCVVTCGNGRIEPPGEECDDGPSGNSDQTPNACRSTCRRAHCGDHVLDQGEACDDGATNSDATANACRTTCVAAFCGDGVIDDGEVCDPGGNASLDATVCQNSQCEGSDAGTGHRRSRGGCSTVAASGSSLLPGLAWFVALLALRARSRRSTR